MGGAIGMQPLVEGGAWRLGASCGGQSGIHRPLGPLSFIWSGGEVPGPRSPFLGPIGAPRAQEIRPYGRSSNEPTRLERLERKHYPSEFTMTLPQLACATLLLSCATTACSLPGAPAAEDLTNFSTPSLARATEPTTEQPQRRCSSEHGTAAQSAASTLRPASFAMSTTTTAGFSFDEDAQASPQRSDQIAVPKWALEPSSKELARRAGQFRVAQGWFLSLGAAYSDISDEHLNGNLLLVGTDTIVLADPEPGFGGAVSLGYRFDKMAFEFIYLQTEHDAVHVFPAAGTAYDATFKSFALNLRHYFNRQRRFQPFVSLGLASTQFIIKTAHHWGPSSMTRPSRTSSRSTRVSVAASS